MRNAAELLLIERDAIRPVLESTDADGFDLDTVCVGWSVRDVIAHCAAALTMVSKGEPHGFSPAENQADVVERRSWPLRAVLGELYAGYESAAGAIDVAGGALDGIGLGEWIHGGDVREPLGADDPYASAGSDLAVGLLVERSVLRRATRVAVDIDGVTYLFGVGSLAGTLRTDVETFVRLTSGRRPDPARYELADVGAGDLILFA
jgi:uncharacterized protein (TIGR03083 family)